VADKKAASGKATIHRLTPADGAQFAAMLDLFGAVFEEPETYGARRPDAGYIARLLANPGFIALLALEGDAVVGALTAYELPKFEQARSEIYIYDLAVAETHRRRGIATALIAEVRTIARAMGAWVVMIQADGDNPAAIALYSKLGRREEVLHFDIAP